MIRHGRIASKHQNITSQYNNGPDRLHRTTWHGSIQSVTQFKFWTDFSHGNEVAHSRDQRFFFSSLTRLRREPSVSIRKKYPLEPRVLAKQKTTRRYRTFSLLYICPERRLLIKKELLITAADRSFKSANEIIQREGVKCTLVITDYYQSNTIQALLSRP